MADGAGVLARGRPVIVCHVWMCTGTICSGGNGQGGQRVWCTLVSDSTFLKDSIYIELRRRGTQCIGQNIDIGHLERPRGA